MSISLFRSAGETEDIVNGNTTSPGTSQITHVKDSTQTTNITSASPPNEMKLGSAANKYVLHVEL
jgi:hypothetical protein